MEESPHLAGDQFCACSSSYHLTLFISQLWSGGPMSPPKRALERRRRRRRTRERSLRHTQDVRSASFSEISSETRAAFSWRLSLEFSYLSLLCLQPSVYTHILPVLSACTLRAASRDLPKLKLRRQLRQRRISSWAET